MVSSTQTAYGIPVNNCLDQFLTVVNALPDGWAYFLLGLSAFVENVFPPIPGDTITAFGAFLVGTRKLTFWGVYAATTAGSMTGFLLLFRIGGFLGRRFFLEKDIWFLKARDIRKAEAWFQKYGYLLIALNRFLPGIRSAVAVVGGISKLRVTPVTLLALASCGVWNLLWIWMGWLLGTNWETVREKMTLILTRYNTAVFALFALVALVWIIRKIRGTRR
jgi:membrane protein DedA with SNARE-associated domain